MYTAYKTKNAVRTQERREFEKLGMSKVPVCIQKRILTIRRADFAKKVALIRQKKKLAACLEHSNSGGWLLARRI